MEWGIFAEVSQHGAAASVHSCLPLSYFATTFGVGRIKSIVIRSWSGESSLSAESRSAALCRPCCVRHSSVHAECGTHCDPNSNFCAPWSGILHFVTRCNYMWAEWKCHTIAQAGAFIAPSIRTRPGEARVHRLSFLVLQPQLLKSC